jgi:hypothetical protein
MSPGPGTPYFGDGGASERLRVPDGITPIRAYRIWEIDQFGTVTSLGGDPSWPESAWVYAQCSRGPRDGPFDAPRHHAPAEGCSCGIYAVKSPGSLKEVVGMSMFVLPAGERPSERRRAVGVVELAGKVIEHHLGYRAERARIAGIAPITPFMGRDKWGLFSLYGTEWVGDGGEGPPEAA